MKNFILALIITEFGLYVSPCFAEQTKLVIHVQQSDQMLEADLSTDLDFYRIHPDWAADVCYRGEPAAAVEIIRRMFRNENLDFPDNRNFFASNYNRHSLVVIVRAEIRNRYQIDRKIPHCADE